MNTKEEIQSLKQKWLAAEKEYSEKTGHTLSTASIDDGNLTADLKREDEDNKKLWNEVIKNKNDYQQACKENFEEALSKEFDDTLKECMIKDFYRVTNNSDDYDEAMDMLNLW